MEREANKTRSLRAVRGGIGEGDEIGSYRIVGKLGAGGMGTVYVGKHVVLGRAAAIKVLLPEHGNDEQMMMRFVNEARAATAIRHPGIVEVYDIGTREDGSAYIAMELLEGEDLHRMLRRMGPLAPGRAVLFAYQACSALAAAHQRGIIHRDLKPSNLVVVKDPQVPGGERIKILDFGIAKVPVPGGSGAMTVAGALMGTPEYMAPEQWNDASAVDPRSDVYAMGCVLYQMLCGRPPFTAPTAIEIMTAQLEDTVVPPSGRAQGVSPELDAVVMRALAKEPAERYADAVELGTALYGLLEESPLPGLGGALAPSPPMARVSPVAPASAVETQAGPPAGRGWLVMAVALAGVVAGVAGYLVLLREDRPAVAAAASAPEAKDVADEQAVGAAPASAAPVVATPDAGQMGSESEPSIAVEVRSEPSGAQVYTSSGEYLGNTPLELTGPSGTREQVTLKLADHEDASVEIAFDEPHKTRTKLKRRAVARVVIQSSPEGAEVWDGDTLLGKTPYHDEFPAQRERRVLTLKHAGCEDKRVRLKGNENDSASVTLSCRQAP